MATQTAKNKHYLLDVRTPAEYSTGALAQSVNIEFQNVPAYITEQEHAPKDAVIDLYCRSGRRSGIAKAELEALGYLRVRDLGPIERAKEVLEREQAKVDVIGKEKSSSAIKVETKELKESTDALLEGLKGLD